MVLKNAWLVFSTVLLSLALAQEAWACECKPDVTFETALEEASVVFIGRVEDRKQSGRRPSYNEINFVVFPNREFKGFEDLPKTQTLLIHTPAKIEECGIDFAPGFEYLVFATGNPAFLKTTSCQRTEVLDKAMADQERLMRIQKRKK